MLLSFIGGKRREGAEELDVMIHQGCLSAGDFVKILSKATKPSFYDTCNILIESLKM